MDKAEEMHIAEMDRLRKAIQKTESPYLKRDYQKKIRSMEKELEEYRRYRYGH